MRKDLNFVLQIVSFFFEFNYFYAKWQAATTRKKKNKYVADWDMIPLGLTGP